MNQQNANQSNEMSPHNSETGTHYKEQKQPVLAEMWGKMEPYSLLLGMSSGTACFEKKYAHFSKT